MLSYDCGLCSLCSVQLCSAQLCSLCCYAVRNCVDVQPVLWLCAKNVLPYDSYQPIMQWNRIKKYNLNWINSILFILIFEKIESGRRLPLICRRPTLPLFNFEFIVNWRESTKKDFKLDWVYRKRSRIKMKKRKVRI